MLHIAGLMAHSKKTRKVGLIGVRKDPNKPRKPSKSEQQTRLKKTKGKPAGSRNNVEVSSKAEKQSNASKDPRLGSKKAVQLVKTDAPTKVKQRKYATPAQELASLESDERLNKLLDRIDAGDTLNQDDNAYVQERTARHKVLCDLMGIKDETEDEVIDPLDQLDAFSIDDFK